MKAKKYWILALAVVCCGVLLSAKERSADKKNYTPFQQILLASKWIPANKKEILQGLDGVYVVVEKILPEVEKYGLTKQAIQTDTELLLRQNGIKVLTYEEMLKTPRQQRLYINVNVNIGEEIKFAAASITINFQEIVLLLWKPSRICIHATTWERGSVTLCGVGRIKDIRGPVKDYVREFVNDYLAVNPKETEAKTKNNK